MYFTGRDIKSKEGQASPYGKQLSIIGQAPMFHWILLVIAGNQDHPKGDKAMTSSEVSDAVSIPKPTDKDRLPAGIPNKADAWW